MKLPQLKSKSQEWLRRPNLIWLLPVAIAAFIALYLDQSHPTRPDEAEKEAPASADTYIPAGFVLVPVEVANYESLDSILGQFGIVDLYLQPASPGRRSVKIAEKIKLLRAPLNPNHFAVLAREEDSARLVSYAGPFTVVVLNPSRDGTEIEKSDEKSGRAKEKRTRSAGRILGLEHDENKSPRRSRIEVEVSDVE
jgi:hypothetical protein